MNDAGPVEVAFDDVCVLHRGRMAQDFRNRRRVASDDFSLRASAGISIHWRSPMGPIRFDFSQVLAKEDYDKTETFKFSTSTRF